MHTRPTPPITQGVLFLPDNLSFTTNIARVSVLRRALLSGARAGLQTWLILTYADPDIVRAHLDGDARLQQVAYDVIDLRVMDPKALGERLPQGEVIAVSCHAVFNAQTLTALQAQPSPTLAALAETGLFRCGHDLLAQAIEDAWEAMPKAADPLAPVLSALRAAVHHVNTLDISPYLWLPLADFSADAIAQIETQMLQRLGRDGDSPIVRLIARRLSRLATRRLIHTRIRPNHVTLVSGGIGIAGALCLAQPRLGWQVIGSLLFLLSTVIDGCDGELARLTMQESAFGAKLDVIMDNVVHGVLFPAIALGLYRQQGHPIYLILGAFALGGVFLSMWVFLPHVLSSQTVRNRQTRLHESLASRDFAYFLPLLAIFGLLHWFLWATVIGSYTFAGIWLLLRRRQPA
jgi:phosphatidylglycerophosphate synthase